MNHRGFTPRAESNNVRNGGKRQSKGKAGVVGTAEKEKNAQGQVVGGYREKRKLHIVKRQWWQVGERGRRGSGEEKKERGAANDSDVWKRLTPSSKPRLREGGEGDRA